MTFLKRAFLTISRKSGKSGLVLVLTFVLGTVMAGAFSVRQAIQTTEEQLWRRMPPVATVSQEDQSTFGTWLSPLTSDYFSKIADLPYVAHFDFNLISNANSIFSSNLVRYWNPEWGSNDPDSLNHFQVNLLQSQPTDYEWFRLHGVNNLDLMDIQAGLIQLVQGETFTEDNENAVIISQAFAHTNQLSIGSILMLEDIIFDTRNFHVFNYATLLSELVFDREILELEVVGIFELAGDVGYGSQEEWTGINGEQEILNRLYVPLPIVDRHLNRLVEFNHYLFGHAGDFEQGFNSIFLLNDPRDIPAFAEASQQILPESWRIFYLDDDFDVMIAAMDNLLWIADLVFWFSIFAVLTILSLLLVLNLKDRKQEIGIYLAMGERKLTVLLQILLETVVIASIAIFLSLFAGNFLGNQFSQQLLEQDMLAQLEMKTEDLSIFSPSPHLPQLANFNLGEMSMEEMLDTFDMSLTPEIIFSFYGLGFGVIILSSLPPMIFVLRLSPKKILL